MKRAGCTILFLLAGFASLLVADAADDLACSHFAGFCSTYSGPCPGIDTCTPEGWDNLRLAAVYFGPAIVFGIVGFRFGKRRRPAIARLTLLAAHSAVMLLVIRSTN